MNIGDLRGETNSRIVDLPFVGDFHFEQCSRVGDLGGALIPNIEKGVV